MKKKSYTVPYENGFKKVQFDGGGGVVYTRFSNPKQYQNVGILEPW